MVRHDPARRLEAVHPWEADIHGDHVRLDASYLLESLLGRSQGGRHDQAGIAGNDVQEKLPDDEGILDDHHANLRRGRLRDHINCPIVASSSRWSNFCFVR
jgi:hypothetical protein